MFTTPPRDHFTQLSIDVSDNLIVSSEMSPNLAVVLQEEKDNNTQAWTTTITLFATDN